MVKQSLPTPEIRGSNPVIGNIFLLNVCRKDEKKMEAGNGPFVKKSRHGQFYNFGNNNTEILWILYSWMLLMPKVRHSNLT